MSVITYDEETDCTEESSFKNNYAALGRCYQFHLGVPIKDVSVLRNLTIKKLNKLYRASMKNMVEEITRNN